MFLLLPGLRRSITTPDGEIIGNPAKPLRPRKAKNKWDAVKTVPTGGVGTRSTASVIKPRDVRQTKAIRVGSRNRPRPSKNSSPFHRTSQGRQMGRDGTRPYHARRVDLTSAPASGGSRQSALHPVLVATETHFLFESLHLFFDGNGRTGRLLLNWPRRSAGFPLTFIQVEERARHLEALDLLRQNRFAN